MANHGLATQVDDPYGYLLVHFIEDAQGYAERIYLDLSDGDDPEVWRPLNGGRPVLTSRIGTTGVRDPYLVRDPGTGRVYILATDLRVFGDPTLSEDQRNWDHWSRHGSTDLMVWWSDDLVHWDGPHPLDMSRRPDGTHAGLGMAWAPEALWVPDYYPEGHEGGRGAFVVYWSSKLFAADDPEHAAADAYDHIMWGATRDFTDATYEFGGVLIDRGHNTIDTTMVQHRLADGTVRTYRATKDNGPAPHAGIWLDATDATRWWEPDAEWTVIQEHIGAEWTENGDPAGVEGPALFDSHSDDRTFLYVDVIPTIGYRPMVTTDPDHGFDYLRDGHVHMAPHTKHGGVLTLTRAEYERIQAADAAGAYAEAE